MGTPIVTTLVGPVGSAIATARSWSMRNGHRLCVSQRRDIGGLLQDWLRELTVAHDLREVALRQVAEWEGKAPAEVDRLFRQPCAERSLLARDLRARAPVAAFCAVALELGASSALEFSWPGAPSDPRERLACVLEALGQAREPALLVAFDVDDRHERLQSATRALAALAEHCARLPAFLAVHEVAWHRIEADCESHVKGMLRAGLTRLTRPVSTFTPPEQFKASARALVGAGASPETVGLFQRAVEAVSEPPSNIGQETAKARSRAEAFLFHVLQECPTTSGLFELNGKLVTAPDSPPWEIDLVSHELHLAMEVDGYYHFGSDEAYRRDRRKDLALQRAGYIVVRVLATDVVSDIENILRVTKELVREQREAPKA